MTIESLIGKVGEIDTWVLGVYFVSPPILVWAMNRIGAGRQAMDRAWRYAYAFWVYLVCVPGMFSSVLTAYAMFFVRQNLLQVNFFVYFFPIVSMTTTLVLVRKRVDWSELPGVNRLYALMIVIAVSFALALAVHKSRLWILFGGSIGMLIVFVVFFFALLKWGMYMLFRSKDEPKIRQPSFPDFQSTRQQSRGSAEQELKRFKRKMGIND